MSVFINQLAHSTMAINKSKPARWSSPFVFILAATGAAVGLGNIWKFPYEVASQGGSAFVLTYVVCLILLGIPLLIAEMCLGRLGRANPIKTLYNLAKEEGHSTKWRYLGWLNIATLIGVLSFYSVVAGWSIKYLIASIMGTFNHIDNQQLNAFWQQTMANPGEIIGYHAVFMVLTITVVARGIRQGIETASKILMPLLFLCLLLLVGYSYHSPGFQQGWDFLFAFKPEAIGGITLVKAFGQTCFTLAIGAGCMLVYGAYVEDDTNLGTTAYVIAILNLLVAILVGLAIFPLIFSFHLTPIGGPGLIFQTVPIAFAQMPWGQLFASLFFALILFAAWTSSISMAEPVVMMLIENWRLSRYQASLLTGSLTWTLGIPSALSFNVWEHHPILGYPNFFVCISEVTTDYMLPVGILGYAIFTGWQVAFPRLYTGLHFTSLPLAKLWYGLIRYLAPIALIAMLLWHPT